MATEAEWRRELSERGAIFFPDDMPPRNKEWDAINESVAGYFTTKMGSAGVDDIKRIRDRMAKEMRKDGWTVWVEPCSYVGGRNTDECSFSAMRKRNGVVGRMAKRKINNPITYEGNRFGHYLVTTVEEIEWTRDIHGTTIARPPKHEMYIQSDWDFPELAKTFGWNGKILPATKIRAVNIDPKDEISAQIYSAIQYLDDNEGKVVEDPGYWEGEYTTEEENDAIKAAQTISVTTRKWGIIAVYDNGGKTADRYTVYLKEHECLILSSDCNMPNGVNMIEENAYWPHSDDGKKITFEQLLSLIHI